MAPRGGDIELESFLGSWIDSMGNHVKVSWSRQGNRGGQLDVVLEKKPGKGNRAPIKLNVKQLDTGKFVCGHFNLDERESHEEQIVWLDVRNHGKSSVWKRDDRPADDRTEQRTRRRHAGERQRERIAQEYRDPIERRRVHHHHSDWSGRQKREMQTRSDSRDPHCRRSWSRQGRRRRRPEQNWQGRSRSRRSCREEEDQQLAASRRSSGRNVNSPLPRPGRVLKRRRVRKRARPVDGGCEEDLHRNGSGDQQRELDPDGTEGHSRPPCSESQESCSYSHAEGGALGEGASISPFDTNEQARQSHVWNATSCNTTWSSTRSAPGTFDPYNAWEIAAYQEAQAYAHSSHLWNAPAAPPKGEVVGSGTAWAVPADLGRWSVEAKPEKKPHELGSAAPPAPPAPPPQPPTLPSGDSVDELLAAPVLGADPGPKSPEQIYTLPD
eukprot:TRINITY_DN95284_c0_g1_i1.p1 TRINITY_DN95284_c0_g1~~TRINITY_DN95284_c0_g1_i1.p1  ORF type:complete len:440 (+),score=77.52 TRINITY_DN95284_c0_g1_i1:23-1342(+)